MTPEEIERVKDLLSTTPCSENIRGTIAADILWLPIRVGTDGAMMDVLTRRIYRNAGTGAFGYGNDLRYPIPAE